MYVVMCIKVNVLYKYSILYCKLYMTYNSIEINNVPFTKSAVISNRAFGVAGPVLWNALPRDIRAITTLTVFKSQLKTHLFTEYYVNV